MFNIQLERKIYMKKEIENLKLLFKYIKNKEFNKNLRKGTTGIGYTFESLINKNEDNQSSPDFNSIEIKTKLGYTKSPLTLFTLTPIKENDRSVKYLLENFGYPNKNLKYKSFRTDAYLNKNNIGSYDIIVARRSISNTYNIGELLLIIFSSTNSQTNLHKKINFLCFIY